MCNTPSRCFVILVMLFSFLVQTVAGASTMTCQPVDETFNQRVINSKLKQTKATHVIADYSLDTFIDNEESCCDIECCDAGCICLTSGCASVVYMNMSVYLSYYPLVNKSLFINVTEHPSSLNTAVFRPPIFTS